MADTVIILSNLLAASAFGAMLFFGAVVAPLVFTRLPEETAGPFIRQVFPVYYAVLGAVTGLAGLLALPEAGGGAIALLLVSVGFGFARQVLMPRINDLRDRELNGEEKAGRLFSLLHRSSVVLNATQMVVLLVVVVTALRDG